MASSRTRFLMARISPMVLPTRPHAGRTIARKRGRWEFYSAFAIGARKFAECRLSRRDHPSLRLGLFGALVDEDRALLDVVAHREALARLDLLEAAVDEVPELLVGRSRARVELERRPLPRTAALDVQTLAADAEDLA